MPEWKKNIFIRAIRLRITLENKTAEDIILDYISLTQEEKDTILIDIQ